MPTERQDTDAAAGMEAAFAAAVAAFRDMADFSVLDEGDLRRTVAVGRPFAFLNSVVRLELDPGTLEERVTEVASEYRTLGLPANWWLSEASRPADLAARLEGLGFVEVDEDLGMVIDLESRPDGLAAALEADARGLSIAAVESGDDLDDWVAAMAASYGWSDADKARQLRQLYDPRRAPKAGRHQVLARLDGRAVAVASLFIADGLAWVTNIGTVPDARGRGIGAAITARCLALAIERGHGRAWLAASAMGAPVYRRLGFVGTGPLRAFQAPAAR